MSAEQLLCEYTYARANGFDGSLKGYADFQYELYQQVCERCEIAPMTFDAWFDATNEDAS